MYEGDGIGYIGPTQCSPSWRCQYQNKREPHKQLEYQL